MPGCTQHHTFCEIMDMSMKQLPTETPTTGPFTLFLQEGQRHSSEGRTLLSGSKDQAQKDKPFPLNSDSDCACE